MRRIRESSGPDQVKERIAAIVSDPPIDLRLDAIDQATYQTFTSAPGELTKRLLVGELGAIGWPADPAFCAYSRQYPEVFVRTHASGSSDGACACRDIAAGGARRISPWPESPQVAC